MSVSRRKLLLTMILNWPNAKCEGNGLYRRMRRLFRSTFRICEDIKRKDHRDISKSLQYYTAKAINGALLDAQAQGDRRYSRCGRHNLFVAA